MLQTSAPTARHDAWFAGAVPRWKRVVARLVAAGNRGLDRLAPCRLAYRWQLERGLRVTRLTLPLRPASRPLAGLRLAFLSDLHAGSYLHERELDRVFARVAAEGPDAVLLGGDLVHTRRREIELYTRPLRRLRPPLGIHAVPGNHERFGGAGLQPWVVRLQDLGVRVLLDRGRRLARDGGSLWLCGVDDLAEGRPHPERALAGRRADETAICLSHHPDLFPALAARGADLVLSGHTHGGQIAPLGRVLVRHSMRGFHRGEYRDGAARLYVGRGVGAAILPLRLGASPELVLVELVAD